MLFNSFVFIFVFLPTTLTGFFALSRIGPAWGATWLTFASIVFYGAWDIRYVPLLTRLIHDGVDLRRRT